MKIKWWYVLIPIIIDLLCGGHITIPLMYYGMEGTLILLSLAPYILSACCLYLIFRRYKKKKQAVRKINNEMDEIESVLNQLDDVEQTDGKVIKIWDLPHKKQ